MTLKNVIKTYKNSFPLLVILFRKYIKGYLDKDEILMSVIRSFFSCYSARLYLSTNSDCSFFLWEGEFHLIPYLDFSLKQKEIIIDILIKSTKKDSISFILLEKPVNESIRIIEEDQLSGKNKRFSSREFRKFKKYIFQSLKHQESMINILNKKGVRIYKFKDSKDICLKNISMDI